MKIPLIIEFVGLPCAGKTTNAKKLVKYLREKGLNIPEISQLQKLKASRGINAQQIIVNFQFLFFLIRRIGLFSNILGYSFQVKPFNKKRLSRALILLKTLFVIEKNYWKGYEYIVLEEGIIQNIWSINLFTQEKNNSYNNFPFHKLKKFLNVVVYLDEDIEKILDRLGKRPKKKTGSRFNLMPRDVARRNLLENQNDFDEIIRQAKNRMNFEVIRVSNLEFDCADFEERIKGLEVQG